jgi:glycine cleavage system regulatory protein
VTALPHPMWQGCHAHKHMKNKKQQLVVTILSDSKHIIDNKQLIEHLLDSNCTNEYTQLNQIGAQHCLVASFSGSWEHIAKLEIHIKKICQAKPMVLTLYRGQHETLVNEQCYAYQLQSMSTVEQDLSAALIDFFSHEGVRIASMQNEIIHNRYHYRMRYITMRLAVPHDTDLMALHEAVNDILDDHNADGELSICQDF